MLPSCSFCLVDAYLLPCVCATDHGVSHTALLLLCMQMLVLTSTAQTHARRWLDTTLSKKPQRLDTMTLCTGLWRQVSRGYFARWKVVMTGTGLISADVCFECGWNRCVQTQMSHVLMLCKAVGGWPAYAVLPGLAGAPVFPKAASSVA